MARVFYPHFFHWLINHVRWYFNRGRSKWGWVEVIKPQATKSSSLTTPQSAWSLRWRRCEQTIRYLGEELSYSGLYFLFYSLVINCKIRNHNRDTYLVTNQRVSSGMVKWGIFPWLVCCCVTLAWAYVTVTCIQIGRLTSNRGRSMNLRHCRADFGRCDSAYAAHFQEQLVVTPCWPPSCHELWEKSVQDMLSTWGNEWDKWILWEHPPKRDNLLWNGPRLKSTRFFVASPGFDKW